MKILRNTFGLLAATLLLTGLPPVVRAQEAPAATTNDSAFVNFNFEGVELHNLVSIVGKMTGRKFVIDDAVTGSVTVVTSERIPVAEIYPLFLTVLEGSGFTVSEENGVARIIALDKPAAAGSAPVVGPDGSMEHQQGLVTRVLRLQHVNALDVRKIFEPMVRGGKEGAVEAFPATNHLIITDTARSIRRLEQILAELDRPGSAGLIEVIPLKHASAEDIAAQVSQAMNAAERAGASASRHLQKIAGGSGALPSDITLVPALQANQLIVVATPVEMQSVKDMVALLDTEAAAGRGNLNSIFLKYHSVEDLAKNLTALLQQNEAGTGGRRISIQPDVPNNALLVDASPTDFRYLQQLVNDLDRMPQQVLVEVLIAEVGVTDNLELGVEWAAIDEPKNGSTTIVGRSRPGESDDILDLVSQGVFPQGLSFGLARGTITTSDGSIIPRIPFYLRALAQDREVKIVSKPALLAQNNTESTVTVVDNIPILKSTIEGGGGTTRDVIQNIDRMDVGLKLTLTPFVNPDNQVTLELNPIIEAIIDEGPADTPFTPTIARREISTTVTVPDGETVIISGLLREDEVQVESRVPLLGRIPLIGRLFRSTSLRKQRTNLLIFVTPHVVTDVGEARKRKALWERQTGIADRSGEWEAPKTEEE